MSATIYRYKLYKKKLREITDKINFHINEQSYQILKIL